MGRSNRVSRNIGEAAFYEPASMRCEDGGHIQGKGIQRRSARAYGDDDPKCQRARVRHEWQGKPRPRARSASRVRCNSYSEECDAGAIQLSSDGSRSTAEVHSNAVPRSGCGVGHFLPTLAASPDAHFVPLTPPYPCRLRSQIGTPASRLSSGAAVKLSRPERTGRLHFVPLTRCGTLLSG